MVLDKEKVELLEGTESVIPWKLGYQSQVLEKSGQAPVNHYLVITEKVSLLEMILRRLEFQC